MSVIRPSLLLPIGRDQTTPRTCFVRSCIAAVSNCPAQWLLARTMARRSPPPPLLVLPTGRFPAWFVLGMRKSRLSKEEMPQRVLQIMGVLTEALMLVGPQLFGQLSAHIPCYNLQATLPSSKSKSKFTRRLRYYVPSIAWIPNYSSSLYVLLLQFQPTIYPSQSRWRCNCWGVACCHVNTPICQLWNISCKP